MTPTLLAGRESPAPLDVVVIATAIQGAVLLAIAAVFGAGLLHAFVLLSPEPLSARQDRTSMPLLARVLYGGLTEEVLVRAPGQRPARRDDGFLPGGARALDAVEGRAHARPLGPARGPAESVLVLATARRRPDHRHRGAPVAKVPPERTGILLVNHATRDGNRWFDPKIGDTLVLNDNIRRELLRRHPALREQNIVAAWFGRREENPVTRRHERTREIRGENLGEAYLYETDELPTGWQGHLYWDALERLEAQGVEHIVVAFPQIMVGSVLNLVELPNQIAKDIDWRSWSRIESLDFDVSEFGHLGHDRSRGRPDPRAPVQQQYRGT